MLVILVGGGEVLVERPVGDVGDVRPEWMAWGQGGRGQKLEHVGQEGNLPPWGRKVEDRY